MSERTFPPIRSKTLTGLGPPDPANGEDEGYAAGNIPETLRPWTVPNDSGDAEETAEIRIPLAPLLPSLRKRPATPAVTERDRAPGLTPAAATQILLVAIALVGSVTLGWILGSPLVSSQDRAAILERARLTSIGEGEPVLGQPATQAVPESDPSPPSAEEPGLVTIEPSASVELEPELHEDRSAETGSSRARGPRDPSVVDVRPATSLVPNEARIRAIAASVRLDDEHADGRRDAGADGAR